MKYITGGLFVFCLTLFQIIRYSLCKGLLCTYTIILTPKKAQFFLESDFFSALIYQGLKAYERIIFMMIKNSLSATAARRIAGNWRHLWGRMGQIVAIKAVGYYGFTTIEGT